jgi:hypothetical protein
VDQLLTVCANAAITLGTIRSVAMGARRIVRDHIHQLGELTTSVRALADAIKLLEQRVTELEKLAQKG